MTNQWDGQDLPGLFEESLSIFNELERKYTEELYNRCLDILKECQRRIDSLALFSWNETDEDLQTNSIRYYQVLCGPTIQF
jgi:hypothetical protein